MLNPQMEYDIPPFVTRVPATEIDKAGWAQARRAIDDHCDAAHTGRGRLLSISRSWSTSMIGSETMDSRSNALPSRVQAIGRTTPAISNGSPSDRALTESPFKAVLKAMLHIGDDYAEAQEMAREVQKKSPRLRE